MEISAAPAFGFRQREVVAHRVEMWMDFQCAAKTDCRLAVLAKRHVAEPLPGRRAEVIRISRQSFLAIGDGAGEVFSHEADRGALVPTLREVRSNVDDAREFGFCFGKLALLHCVYPNAEDPVRFGISRTAPGSPKHRFRGSREREIIAFECLKQFFFSLRKHALDYL